MKTMKYLLAGRIVTIEKSEFDPSLYVETIKTSRKGKEDIQTAFYRIEGGEKVYTGAGGGSIPDDYINPVQLEEQGKIIILDKPSTTSIKIPTLSPSPSPKIRNIEFYDGDEIISIGSDDFNWDDTDMTSAENTTENPPVKTIRFNNMISKEIPNPNPIIIPGNQFIRIPSVGSSCHYGQDEDGELNEWDMMGGSAIGM
jgi:hypothetical protein